MLFASESLHYSREKIEMIDSAWFWRVDINLVSRFWRAAINYLFYVFDAMGSYNY